MAALRGEVGLEHELGSTAAHGYYEQLISAADNEPRQGTQQADKPPPDWVPFVGAGLAVEEPTYLRWRMLPGLDVQWNGKRFRTNSLGLRSPEIEVAKPAGTYRILLFGSSNSMGHGVNDEEVYARHLEGWLNERLGATGLRVEVVNLSVSGDAPSRRLVRIREQAAQFSPDWILCDASAVDFALEEAHLVAVLRRGLPVPLPYVRSVMERAGLSVTDTPAQVRLKLKGELVSLLSGAYAGWGEEARRLGVPFTVLLLPRTDEEVESPYLFKMLQDLTQANGLDLIDTSKALEGLSLEQYRVSAWDPHPTARGHQAIFEAIQAELERVGGVPGLGFDSAGSK